MTVRVLGEESFVARLIDALLTSMKRRSEKT
jgi:hypothetical protein